MGKHAQVPAPGDVRSRIWRTIVQVGIPAAIGLALILPDVIAAIDADLGEQLPPGFRVAMLGVAATITAVSGVMVKIMAMPKVNDWLSRWTPFGTVNRAEARELDE